MQQQPLQKLIFVYNANSGAKNAILDSLHKVLSPSTYNCNLCDITFGLISEKLNWKEFRETYPLEMEFLHKDEFEKEYASKFGYSFTYPLVLGAASGDLEIIIGTEEMNQLADSDQLIDLIEKRAPVS